MDDQPGSKFESNTKAYSPGDVPNLDFAKDVHLSFLDNIGKNNLSFEYVVTQHLRISGIYWASAANYLLSGKKLNDTDAVTEFVLKCFKPDVGGFSGNILHECHLLYTLSALQVLILHDKFEIIDTPLYENTFNPLENLSLTEEEQILLDNISQKITKKSPSNNHESLDLNPTTQSKHPPFSENKITQSEIFPKPTPQKNQVITKREKMISFIASLQNPDGSFRGDSWGEVDTRFSYAAVNALTLLGGLDAIDKDSAVEFILKCANPDGGFGRLPNSESHGAHIFTGIGTLCLLDSLDLIDCDLLAKWIKERQIPGGGFNGRPEKKPDSCYSWWNLASLAMIDQLKVINRQKLIQFNLTCQDVTTGGLADRPGDFVDVYHTFFSLAGLSLLGFQELKPIDPALALPVDHAKRFHKFVHEADE